MQRKGFTLIELVFVILILGILTAIFTNVFKRNGGGYEGANHKIERSYDSGYSGSN